MAPGMGLNAFVAFELVARRGLTWPQAMTVVFLEGLVITVLVLTRFREAVMDAVPMRAQAGDQRRHRPLHRLHRLLHRGLRGEAGRGPAAGRPGHASAGCRSSVFVIGFVLTAWLMARRVRGALLLGIVRDDRRSRSGSTALFAGWKGFATPGAAQIPRGDRPARRTSRPSAGSTSASPRSSACSAVALVIFSIMLSDFFDTIGTSSAWAARAASSTPAGGCPGAKRVLLVDSIGAMFGGFANASSNTTYIESAAGVAEGGRTGLASVVIGPALPPAPCGSRRWPA